MIHLANVPLLQNVDISAVILVGVIGFVIGFWINMKGSKKSNNTLLKLRKDKKINSERIEALKERIKGLEKKNADLKGGEEKK